MGSPWSLVTGHYVVRGARQEATPINETDHGPLTTDH